MITLSYPLVGIVCLLAAIAITFFWSLGNSRRNHVFSEVVLVALYVSAAGFLWAGGIVPESMPWLTCLLVGLVVGIVAVVLRDVRRFIRHFRYQTYKWTHPYYWYGRVGRAMMGGNTRRHRNR